jgi:ribosomal protein S18 acetylase RimI-like enzyme
LRIRLATNADIVVLASLVQDYWIFESIAGFDRPRVESLLHDLIADPQRGACWVAAADERLCGYLLMTFVFSLEHGGLMAEIDEVFVSREARSAGIGSLLLSCAERDLAGRGMVRLQLQLAVDNPRARLFYERHGFRRRAGYELLDKPLQVA